ncbi:hypothetical protein [Nocardia salmonicida]
MNTKRPSWRSTSKRSGQNSLRSARYSWHSNPVDPQDLRQRHAGAGRVGPPTGRVHPNNIDAQTRHRLITIDGTTEIETVVGDIDSMAEILVTIGLREVRYQENYREKWRIGEVIFDLDTWPETADFSRNRGTRRVRGPQAAADLGLDRSQAKFGSVDTIYRAETGRDLLAEPTLLVDDFAE